MSFSFAGLDHIQITAPLNSEEEVRNFFVDLLLCKEIEKPSSLSHFDSLWFEMGCNIIHVGLDENYFPEKRGHPAFEVNQIGNLMEHLEKNEVPFEEDYNLPGARRFYTYAFFGHRMEFLEWEDKPEAMITELERKEMEEKQ